MATTRQLGLFPQTLDLSAEAALAKRVPAHVRLGTSSWTFRGWAGRVYAGHPTQAELVEDGLAEYARHPLMRTVGVDRSFYQLPTAAEWARYACQLPEGFRCVVKAPAAYSAPFDARTRLPNPGFLDPERFTEDVLSVLEQSFFAHLGPLVFQLSPYPALQLPEPQAFADQLERFFSALPRRFGYAVELRNRELFTPDYLAALRRHRVAHCFNAWERMPSVGEQLDHPGAFTSSFAVCRLLLPQGVGYEEARDAWEPFDRLHEVDEGMRADVVRLSRLCAQSGRNLFVLVGNKAEGCSPLTVRALAERLAEP